MLTKRTVAALLVAAGLLIVAAVGGVVSMGSSGSSAASGLKGLDGRIVAQSPAGSIVRVGASSGAVDSYSLVGPPGHLGFLANSPDGTIWLNSAGDAVTFSGTKIVEAPTAIADWLSGGISVSSSQTFADKGQAVALITREALTPAHVYVIALTSGAEADLGTADAAGGDPQSIGAFVSTPGQRAFSLAHGSAPSDIDVELREDGQAPTVLATAEQLNADVGWLPSTPVQLEVYPSPTGDVVAVVITPLSPIIGDTPMVILNRGGGLLAALTDWRGPMYGSEPVWSPGGHEVAYPTYTTTGAALAITTETGAVEVLDAPMAAVTFGSCVWSPSSNATVCEAREASRDVWLYSTEEASRLIPEPGRGRPLAWISSSL